MRAVVLSLVFVSAAQGATFGAYADPNACVQQDWSRIVPFALPEAEPNMPYGSILGPVPGDPNVWEVPAGPWKRDWARACDPEGDPVSVQFLGGSGPAAPQVDAQAQRWTFAAEVLDGINLWRFEASDGRASRIVTIVAWGRKDAPPVLE